MNYTNFEKKYPKILMIFKYIYIYIYIYKYIYIYIYILNIYKKYTVARRVCCVSTINWFFYVRSFLLCEDTLLYKKYPFKIEQLVQTNTHSIYLSEKWLI